MASISDWVRKRGQKHRRKVRKEAARKEAHKHLRKQEGRIKMLERERTKARREGNEARVKAVTKKIQAAKDEAERAKAQLSRATRIIRACKDAIERITRTVQKLKRRNRKPTLGNVNVSTGNWGGSGSVMDQFVEPFMVARGLPIGSGKRTPAHNAAIGGSPNSDHLTTKTTTDARDFPTFSGEDDARALAVALGNGSWQANSFATFLFSADGFTFRAQILWGAAIAHGDHVHVGISRA